MLHRQYEVLQLPVQQARPKGQAEQDLRSPCDSSEWIEDKSSTHLPLSSFDYINLSLDINIYGTLLCTLVVSPLGHHFD
jgi:hypothetical protein